MPFFCRSVEIKLDEFWDIAETMRQIKDEKIFMFGTIIKVSELAGKGMKEE